MRLHRDFTVTYSGGMDSSLILYFARPKECYVLKGSTQGDYMALPERLGIKVNHVEIPPEGEWNKEDMVRCLEQPFYSWPPNYFLAKEIGKKYRVVLDGLGADEPLGGYHYFKPPYTAEAYTEAHRVSDKGCPYPLYMEGDGLTAMARLHSSHYLPYHFLWRADKCYMRFTIEGRHPFLDPNVFDYLDGLPDEMKQDKKVLRLLCTKLDIPVALEKKGLSMPKSGKSADETFQETYDIWKKIINRKA